MRRPRPSPVETLHRKLLRQLTLWIGVVCALAQLSAAAHDVLVEHVRCAEHGEWVHATHEHAAARAEAVGATSVATRSDADAERAHEHCLLWSDRHNPALAAPTTLEVMELGIGRAPAPGAESPRALSGDVYSLAPKTSPPASIRCS